MGLSLGCVFCQTEIVVVETKDISGAGGGGGPLLARKRTIPFHIWRSMIRIENKAFFMHFSQKKCTKKLLYMGASIFNPLKMLKSGHYFI